MSSLLLALVLAQPVFEVASVKPSEPIKTDTYNINLGRTNHGELSLGNATLAECLKFAYGLSSDIQLDGPEWIRRKGEVIFDVIAKAPADTPQLQLLAMLQTLLTERFQLVMHREKRPNVYLALVKDPKGLKIEEAGANPAGPVSNSFRIGRIVAGGVYIPMLATILSRFLREPVLDQTGLMGRYALKLEWTPDSNDPLKVPDSASTGPSIFTAVRDQLGLKLESRKGPVEVLVVDSALRVPVSN